MTPPTQREALSVLAEVVDMSRDIRLGQLLAHLGFLGEDQVGRSLGNIDDDESLAVLYHHRGELAARLTDTTNKSPTPMGAAIPTSSDPASVESAPADKL